MHIGCDGWHHAPTTSTEPKMPRRAQQAERAYDDWKSADAAAREAETRLSAAWDESDVTGEPPSETLIAEVTHKRVIANDRLTAAMNAMRAHRPAFSQSVDPASDQSSLSPER